MDGFSQSVRRLADAGRCIGKGHGWIAPVDQRIAQQILNQALHADTAVDDEANEVIGVGVQLSLIAAGQQMGVADHDTERFLQIMGGHLGEPRQFDIGAFQLLHGAPQPVLDFLLIRNVLGGAAETGEPAIGMLDRYPAAP